MPRPEQKLLQTLSSLDTRNWLARYADFDIAKFEKLWHSGGEDFWNKLAAKQALALFHAAAERVPAYKDFLKKNGIKSGSVKTIRDFSNVPETNKANYVLRYPLAARMWDGIMDSAEVIAASSGTTGEPNFWPRGGYQEFEAALVHEVLYRNLYDLERRRTLLLVGFPVGIYVSGLATLLPSWLIAAKGYPLTVLGVGNNKTELLRALKALGPGYDQVIIAGHPFFIKDVLETARAQRIKLPKAVKTFMCSEGFSEDWRNYLANLAGDAAPEEMVSTYGSSELLLMGYETPLTIAIRNNPEFGKLFTKRLTAPSLFQYNPFLRYIEAVNGELLFTARTGVPAIRFNMHDAGEVVPYAAMQKTIGFKEQKGNWQLPFVTLHGRSDRTLIFYAANIYPEHIRAGLNHASLYKLLTGKFVMRKEYLKNMDQFLEINVELRAGVKDGKQLRADVQKHITAALHRLSMEFTDTVAHHMGKNLTPRVQLWPYQNQIYFLVGVKPKYIL